MGARVLEGAVENEDEDEDEDDDTAKKKKKKKDKSYMSTSWATVILIVIVGAGVIAYFVYRSGIGQTEETDPPRSLNGKKKKKSRAMKGGKREERCRRFFEGYRGIAYPNTRPEWMINPETGRLLEADGMCEATGEIFEHHGMQHYKKGTFNPTDEKLAAQKKRDVTKIKLALERNFNVCIIPYSVKNIEEHCMKWIESVDAGYDHYEQNKVHYDLLEASCASEPHTSIPCANEEDETPTRVVKPTRQVINIDDI